MGMTDDTMLSKVEQSYFYDEFGNSLGSWGSVSNHYLYTGQEYDGSISGLYNLRARYYDMRIGRFVSEDPILQSRNIFLLQDNDLCKWSIQPNYFKYYKFIPQFNIMYVYVANNPINYSDISGLQSFEWMQCCDLIATCIEGACRTIIPEGDPRKKLHDKQCEKEAEDWRNGCLLSEKTGGIDIPYEECQYIDCWPMQ